MFVCVCAGITDRQIAEAVYAGASSVDDLSAALGVGIQCGSCVETAMAIIDEHAGSFDHTLYYQVA